MGGPQRVHLALLDAVVIVFDLERLGVRRVVLHGGPDKRLPLTATLRHHDLEVLILVFTL